MVQALKQRVWLLQVRDRQQTEWTAVAQGTYDAMKRYPLGSRVFKLEIRVVDRATLTGSEKLQAEWDMAAAA